MTVRPSTFYSCSKLELGRELADASRKPFFEVRARQYENDKVAMLTAERLEKEALESN